MALTLSHLFVSKSPDFEMDVLLPLSLLLLPKSTRLNPAQVRKTCCQKDRFHGAMYSSLLFRSCQKFFNPIQPQVCSHMAKEGKYNMMFFFLFFCKIRNIKTMIQPLFKWSHRKVPRNPQISDLCSFLSLLASMLCIPLRTNDKRVRLLQTDSHTHTPRSEIRDVSHHVCQSVPLSHIIQRISITTSPRIRRSQIRQSRSPNPA